MKAVRAESVEAKRDNSFPEPFKSTLGSAEWRGLSDLFGLTQFGVNMEVLHPNAQSALRHWHSKTDEFVFVLEGELVLITDEGESPVSEGMCVGFKAGDKNAHHLVNRSAKTAKFLVVGSRVSGDKTFYPDDDFQWLEEKAGSWHAARKDGSRY